MLNLNKIEVCNRGDPPFLVGIMGPYQYFHDVTIHHDTCITEH